MVRGDSRSDLERSNSVRLAAIVVRDMTTATLMVDSVNLHLASTVTVAILMEHVAAATSYRVGSFELVLQKSSHSQDQVEPLSDDQFRGVPLPRCCSLLFEVEMDLNETKDPASLAEAH